MAQSQAGDDSPRVTIRAATVDSPKNDEDDDDYARIVVRDEELEGSFTFRKLWAFTGPGFLMSIAYLDPGNIESDMQSGILAQYKLLWVLLGATILGLLMQRLSARLGVVTGYHLAEMCFRQYKLVPRILLWIMIEIAIIGSDIQEVIGTAIALHLLSAKLIPIWLGTLLTIGDTFTFLFLDKYGLRKLEFFFGLLIAIMSISFGYEYVRTGPSTVAVLEGMVTPWCKDCSWAALMQAVGIIGAVIMPHNLYLHSALVKSRKINRARAESVRTANFYFFVEAAIALLISFFINVFVVSVFGYGLFEKTNNEVRASCAVPIDADINENFPANNETVNVNLYSAGVFLNCSFGSIALYIWALGILAAGQSSTMTGTYAGQFVMEGFLNLQWARWKRVLFTRIFAIIPTFYVAFYNNLDELRTLNDFLNSVMSIQLPFATIPVIAMTSNHKIMGEFVNGWGNKVMALALSFLVIGINLFYMVQSVYAAELNWPMIVLAAIYGFLYIVFCVYLLVHMAVSMGASCLQSPMFSGIMKNPTDGQHAYDNPIVYTSQDSVRA